MGLQKPPIGVTDSTASPSSMSPAKLGKGPTRKPSTLDPEQIAKQLNKYAHAHSSQFALLLCDATGDHQIYSSSAFNGYLEQWIPSEVRADACQVAVSAAGEKVARLRRRNPNGNDDRSIYPDNADADGDDYDAYDDDGIAVKMEVMGGGGSGGFMAGHLPPPPVDDQNLGLKIRKRCATLTQDVSESSKKKSKPVPRRDQRNSSSESNEPVAAPVEEYKPLVIGDTRAVETFYQTRLRQMQQLMCKVVAKAWIKVIEPKKQSNFPYNRGDESKPSWWPKTVRHKEPDHLMKPERLTLLLTMLRYEKIEISKLEQATSEVMVQIPNERVPLLEEIYRVAKHEERLRRGEIPPETQVYVAASEMIIKSPSQKAPSPKIRRSSLPSERRTSTSSNQPVPPPPPPQDLQTVDEEGDLPSPEPYIPHQPPPPQTITYQQHRPPPQQHIPPPLQALPTYTHPSPYDTVNPSPPIGIPASPFGPLDDPMHSAPPNTVDYYSLSAPPSRNPSISYHPHPQHHHNQHQHQHHTHHPPSHHLQHQHHQLLRRDPQLSPSGGPGDMHGHPAFHNSWPVGGPIHTQGMMTPYSPGSSGGPAGSGGGGGGTNGSGMGPQGQQSYGLGSQPGSTPATPATSTPVGGYQAGDQGYGGGGGGHEVGGGLFQGYLGELQGVGVKEEMMRR